MADDLKNPPPVPESNKQPLPEPYQIPRQLIEQWIAIQPNEYVNVRVTRHDLDQLFFGLTRTFNAHNKMGDCIVAWSNGDLAAANRALEELRRLIVEGDNNVRHFFTALMTSATKV